MKISASGEYPEIIIYDSREHGEPHCHVKLTAGGQDNTIYVYRGGYYAEGIRKKDINPSFQSYKTAILAQFATMGWVVGNPGEHEKESEYYT